VRPNHSLNRTGKLGSLGRIESLAAMTEQALYEIMKRHSLAVLSTVAHTTVPQAALIVSP